MPAGAPNVFSIPPGEPFLASLASAILSGHLPRAGSPAPDPVGLSDIRILLPTRRAVRSLADTFLQVSDRVCLLPRMTPLGDIDEEELLLAGEASVDDLLGDAGLPPAIPALERRLILTRLILEWEADHPSDVRPSVHTPAQASVLAADLARLIDLFDTEQADWKDLDTLVERELSAHWDNALAFLSLLRKKLPAILEDRGLINPMARRNLLLEAEADRLAADAHGHPVIAAGSTGSIPATANLLRVIAGLPNGAVVLPGLDTSLDDAAWEVIGPAHPQYGLKQLLERIGITRRDVQILSRGASPTPSKARSAFLSELMRPADASETWSTALAGTDAASGLEGIRRITAPTQREEALAIALVMRETLEHPGRTAALVTPDRRLARRVQAELARWEITVDDSAGLPLNATPQAAFMLNLLDAAASGFAAVPLIALLKHPLAAFGMDRTEVRRLAGLLEVTALRGLAPRGGLTGLRRAVERCRDERTARPYRAHQAVLAIRDEDWQALDVFLERIGNVLQPLLRLFDVGAPVEAGGLLQAHIGSAEAAAALPEAEDDAPSPLWSDDAGEALSGFLASLMEATAHVPHMPPQDYGAFLGTLMNGLMVRPRFGQHPRLHIWGLLEARLMQADVVILGGLTEGNWPPQAITDAWLNRPMRAGMNLEPPERRIGLTAHDFVQSASAGAVYLSHSEKIDGTPQVPSRWLLRLDALLKGSDAAAGLADDHWVRWALGIDDADAYRPIAMPRPKPPVEARPRKMSVTQVETWIRDPYAIHARMILGLEPLPPLAGDPSAAERGTVIHEVLHRAASARGTPTMERLLDIGREVFADYIDYPEVAAFWWPRFERLSAWLLDEDILSRVGVADRFTEVSGELAIGMPGGPFRLRARADRIDRLADGGTRIYDYKTGRPPSGKQVASGLAPQISLEAAMAMRGGFERVGTCEVEGLTFIRISGGEPPGEISTITTEPPDVLADDAYEGLIRRIAAFDDPDTPYLPRERVETERREHDYDHLARHLEWSRQAGEGGGE